MKKSLIIFSLIVFSGLNCWASHLNIEEIQAKLDSLPENGSRRLKTTLHLELADLMFDQSKVEEAAKEYETVLDLNPNRTEKAHVYYHLARCYENFERLDKVIDSYEQAITYDPKNWRCHRNLGFAYEKAALYQKSLDSLQKALNFKPKKGELYRAMGRVWRKWGLNKEAEKILKAGLPLEDQVNLISRELSYVYEAQGRFKDACDTYLKTLDINSTPAQWGYLIYLAVLSHDKQLADQGLEAIRKKENSAQNVPFYAEMVAMLDQNPEKFLMASEKSSEFRAFLQSVLKP